MLSSSEGIFVDYLVIDADGVTTVTLRAPDGNRIWLTSRPNGRRRVTWRTGDRYGTTLKAALAEVLAETKRMKEPR